MKNKEIEKSKEIFNKFFQEDLYGRFDNNENIILSRGSWNDEVVRLPKFFTFAVNYTLKKHWVGYSDSLGHESTFDALDRFLNIEKVGNIYKRENMALTFGNTATYGTLFRQIKELFGNLNVVTGKPYYPPILKSISSSVESIEFVNIFGSEDEIIVELTSKTSNSGKIVYFLTNYIGVEGRAYSKKYWRDVLKLAKKNGALVVIDEGLWFTPPDYPDEINSQEVIRVVSLSKKYGIPGMKIGFMLGSKEFIGKYYDVASTNYGGPASVFFLLQEFLYNFEYQYKTGDTNWMKSFVKNYEISEKDLNMLFVDYEKTLTANRTKLSKNKEMVTKMINKANVQNVSYYDFGGLNIFIKSDSIKSGYDFFLNAIEKEKLSIFPGECLGLSNQKFMRLTVLESTPILKVGME
ncbi:aminotransferase class I/II-fold pyridoxal phosphate-dependent enzyme, partial [bacterium]|nr:aminotransferase class I/II-fold pyridoxal phosphate-dependent enzyme [bacterium]